MEVLPDTVYYMQDIGLAESHAAMTADWQLA